MSITLSISSIPSISACFPGFTRGLVSSWVRRLNSTSLISELFPDPETPVTAVKAPSGISTSIPLRLFSSAPRIFRKLPFPFRRASGTGICFLPDRYCPVIDSGQSLICSREPAQTISPPCTPAPGPTSTI